MQNQKPASNGAIAASLAFFGVGGLLMAGFGFADIGEDKDAAWIVLIGLVLAISALLLAPIVFRNAEKQREAYEKQLKNHDAGETAPVHHSSGSGGGFFSGIGGIVVIIVVLIVGFWLVRGAWRVASERINPPKWTGFFYYDPNDLNKYWEQGGLAGLDDCRGWVNNQISRDFDGQYDYECGKGCRHESGLSVQVCKETLR